MAALVAQAAEAERRMAGDWRCSVGDRIWINGEPVIVKAVDSDGILVEAAPVTPKTILEAMQDLPETPQDLIWVEQVQTVGVNDPAVKAINENPGWRLIATGVDEKGQTTLTYGWPWPGGSKHG